jgi:hypothetical protein
MAGFLQNILGAGIAGVGKLAGLPELGISEGIQGSNAALLTNAALGANGQKKSTASDANGSVQGMQTGQNFNVGLTGGTNLQINNPVSQQNPTGANTGAGGTGAGAPDLTGLQNLASTGINDYYSKIMGGFDQQKAGVMQDQGSFAGQIGNSYNNQVGDQANALSSAESDVASSKSNIDKNQTEAYSDLDAGLRNAIDSFARRLGAYGATDSSAAEMGKYAFARLGTQQKTEVLKQANDLRAAADTQLTKIRQLHQQNLQKLTQWRDEQLYNLNNQATGQLRQIEQQKTQATADQAKQLSDLALQIRQKAIDNAQQVVAALGQATQSIDQRYGSQAQAAAEDVKKIQFTIGNLGFDPSTGYSTDLNTGADLSSGLGFAQAQIGNGLSTNTIGYAPTQGKKKQLLPGQGMPA